MGEPVAAAKLAMILLAFVAVLLAVERMARRRARFHDAPAPRRRMRTTLSPGAAAAALATCLAPLAVGFAIPAAILARLSLQGGDQEFGARFATLAANSFF